MSNYLSQVKNYGKPQSVFDANLSLQVLGYKQQKYDANAAKIQEVINSYGNIDLVRPEDREYLYNKLNTLISSIKGLKGADIGSNNVTSQILGHISGAMDEHVMKHYGYSQRIRKFEAEMEEKRVKNPKAWNQRNYAFALSEAGYYDYMDPNSDVDDLGQLTYRDYVDVGKEEREIALNLDKFTDVIKQTTKDGFYFVDMEGKELTKEKARNILDTQLSDRAKAQMEIDAWATYQQNMTPEQLNQYFDIYKNNRLESMDTHIATLEMALKNSTNTDRERELREEIAEAKELRNKAEISFSEMSDRGKAYNLHKEDLFNSFANTYFRDRRNVLSQTFRVDSAALGVWEAEYAAMQKRKEEVDNIYGVPQPYNPDSGVNMYEHNLGKAKEYEDGFKSSVNSVLSQLDPEFRDTILNNFKESGREDREQYIFEKLEEYAKEGSGITDTGTVERLNQIRLQKDEYAKRVDEDYNGGIKDIEEAAIPTIYTVSMNNPNISIINEEGRKVSIKQYLLDNEVHSLEDLNKREDIKKQLLAQYYADMALSKGYIHDTEDTHYKRLVTTYGKKEADRIMSTQGTPRFEENMYAIYGSGAPQVLAYYATEYKPERNFYHKSLERLIGKKEAEEYLKKVRGEGAYDTNKLEDASTNLTSIFTFGLSNLANLDNSFEDDGETRQLITKEKVTEYATNRANKRAEIEGRGVDIIIPNDPNSKIWQQSAVYIASSGTSDAYGNPEFIVDKNSPITIRKVDEDHVVFSATTTVSKDGTKLGQRQTKAIAMSQLPPLLVREIDFHTSKQVITANNFPPVKSTPTYPSKDNIPRMEDLTNNVLRGQVPASHYSREQIEFLFSQNNDILGTEDRPTEIGQVFRQMLNDKEITVRSYTHNGKVYPTIYKGETKINTGAYIEDNAIPEAYNKMKYLPEIYMRSLFEGMLQEFRYNNGISTKFNEIKKLY